MSRGQFGDLRVQAKVHEDQLSFGLCRVHCEVIGRSAYMRVCVAV